MFGIGDVIRKVRKERGLSGEQLARKSGIGHMTISEIENGKGNPTLKTLTAIAEALKTDLVSLFVRMRDEMEPKRRRRVTDAELSLLDVWARVPDGAKAHFRPLLDAVAEEAERKAREAATTPPPTDAPQNPGAHHENVRRRSRA